MPEPKYKWNSPHEWLTEKAHDWDREELLDTFVDLVSHIDADTLQDLFQQEMDDDGYFKPVTSGSNLEHKPIAKSKLSQEESVIADLVRVFTEGRCYQTQNPYTRPAVKRALQFLASRHGYADWFDATELLKLEDSDATDNKTE